MNDESQRRRFNEWLEGFSRVGYLLDSYVDMKDDFADGNVTVPVTFKARLEILRVALPEAMRALRKTPKRTLGRVACLAVASNVST